MASKLPSQKYRVLGTTDKQRESAGKDDTRNRKEMVAMLQEAGNEIEITVNGHQHSVTATPDTALLYVLRNELRLNAAKFGCGLSQCGACTVLVDGEPTRSCVYPVGDAVGKEIVTLEGIGTAEVMHPLQQAFLDEQAAQCGYCIPGMIMTAAAFLQQHPQPSEGEIIEALDGNLCRCGSHVRILRAVQRAADAQSSGKVGSSL